MVLGSEPGVDPAQLVVSGVSRGAEAALLLGTTYPGMIHAVVAGSPSSVVNVGYPDTNKPAWTLSGKPIPAAPLSNWNQPSPADHPEAVIPVEKIAGPILLTCGTADQVWNGCGFVPSRPQLLRCRPPRGCDGGLLLVHAGLHRRLRGRPGGQSGSPRRWPPEPVDLPRQCVGPGGD